MGKILVASSRASRRRDLLVGLEAERHVVTEACTITQAIDGARCGSHDVLVLDAELEDEDQPAVCRRIREVADVGLIALIAEFNALSCAAALDAGADDYLPERFVPAELNARVRAILRRVRPAGFGGQEVLLGDRTVDLRSHKIRGPGDAIANLTPREFQVLKCLIDRTGQPVAIRDLARQVWQRDGTGDLEYVRIVISQLRGKLERDRNRPAHILTERAGKYSFMPAYRSDSRSTVL
jgi:DNA-binding response OmpR family regulator